MGEGGGTEEGGFRAEKRRCGGLGLAKERCGVDGGLAEEARLGLAE